MVYNRSIPVCMACANIAFRRRMSLAGMMRFEATMLCNVGPPQVQNCVQNHDDDDAHAVKLIS